MKYSKYMANTIYTNDVAPFDPLIPHLVRYYFRFLLFITIIATNLKNSMLRLRQALFNYTPPRTLSK